VPPNPSAGRKILIAAAFLLAGMFAIGARRQVARVGRAESVEPDEG
jgi:hypothetical protein